MGISSHPTLKPVCNEQCSISSVLPTEFRNVKKMCQCVKYITLPGIPVQGASKVSRLSMSKLTWSDKLLFGSILLRAIFVTSMMPYLSTSSIPKAVIANLSMTSLSYESISRKPMYAMFRIDSLKIQVQLLTLYLSLANRTILK